MDQGYIDKLIHDIQQYLREEDSKKQVACNQPIPAPPDKPAAVKRKPIVSRAAIELILLLASCTTALLTVAIVLIGLMDGQAGGPVGTMTLLIIGGSGMFLSIVLISMWKCVVLLGKIEENTRRILRSKIEANAILERLIHR